MDKIQNALLVLLEWATTGDRTGNPYSIPAVKYAIRVLQEEKCCPDKWCDIFYKPSEVYLNEALEEEKRRNED